MHLHVTVTDCLVLQINVVKNASLTTTQADDDDDEVASDIIDRRLG